MNDELTEQGTNRGFETTAAASAGATGGGAGNAAPLGIILALGFPRHARAAADLGGHERGTSDFHLIK